MSHYELWTDGSCDNDNGIGGWAYAIVKQPENVLARQDCKGAIKTTNNRMELQAVIEGLSALNPRAQLTVEVISDSAYVINCFSKKWYVKWMRGGWRNSEGDEVKNRDLWEQLLKLVEPFGDKLTWKHVRGHQKKGTHPWNELCDQQAGNMRRTLLG